MLTLVDRHRRWIQWPSAVLALLKQRRCPKTRARLMTLPRLPEVYRMPINYIKDTSIFWTCSAAVVLATVHANEIFPLQTTFECLFCHYNIFIYVFLLVVLLLSSCYWRNLNQNMIIHLKETSSVFKQFLIGLKQNLWEEDNLSARDKWPVPKVSSVWRFYCISWHNVSWWCWACRSCTNRKYAWLCTMSFHP